jgi:hypothetical protein
VVASHEQLSSSRKAVRQILLDSLEIGLAESSNTAQDQPAVEREELHPHEAAPIKASRLTILNPCIALPGGLGLGGDHGENYVPFLVEGATTHHQSRPPLTARRL